MTQYNTTTLAVAIMGEEAVETNRKAATRTLRKFLRDELGDGKAVVGKGARYALDYNKRELTALTKKFKAWEIAQEEAKIARREALEAAKAPKVDKTPESPIEDDADNTDEAGDDEMNPDEGDIDAMILEMQEEDENA